MKGLFPAYEGVSASDPNTIAAIRDDWRAGFERWCKSRRISVERNADGSYRYLRVNVHWAAYFERCKSLLNWELRELMQDEQP